MKGRLYANWTRLWVSTSLVERHRLCHERDRLVLSCGGRRWSCWWSRLWASARRCPASRSDLVVGPDLHGDAAAFMLAAAWNCGKRSRAGARSLCGMLSVPGSVSVGLAGRAAPPASVLRRACMGGAGSDVGVCRGGDLERSARDGAGLCVLFLLKTLSRRPRSDGAAGACPEAIRAFDVPATPGTTSGDGCSS